MFIYGWRKPRRIHNKELTVVICGVGIGRVGTWIKRQAFLLLYSYTVMPIEFFTSLHYFILSIFQGETNSI